MPQGSGSKTSYSRHQPGQWAGTESNENTGAVQELKPMYPRKSPDNYAFQAESAHYETYFDASGNECPKSYPFDHTEATAGMGQAGKFQFEDVDRSGTSASMSGYNEIPYGQGPAFPTGPSTVIVDTSKSDRGRES